MDRNNGFTSDKRTSANGSASSASNDASRDDGAASASGAVDVPEFLRPQLSARSVDRKVVCPFLVHVWWFDNESPDLSKFRAKGIEPTTNTVKLYTWTDCTLRELVGLVQDVIPPLRRPGATLHVDRVFTTLETRQPQLRQLGKIHADPKDGILDDKMTLWELRFEPGNYIFLTMRSLPPSHRREERR